MTETHSKIAASSGVHLKISLPGGGFTRLAVGALFGGAVSLALGPILVRLSQVGPVATAFWRLALALPVLWLWMFLEGQGTNAPRQPATAADYRRLIAAGLFFTGDLATWHWSLKLTTVANSTLLANSAPIFVTLGSWLLFRQRVSLTFGLGLVTTMAGATLLIGNSFSLSLQHFGGDFLAVVTAMFYAAYLLTVKRLRVDFSAATIMAWSGVTTCASLLLVTLLSADSLLPFTWQGWTVLIALALLSQVGGQSLIAYALAHLPAAFSSVSLSIQPVISTFFAWLILNEAIGPWQALGGVIVLLGVFIARRGSFI